HARRAGAARLRPAQAAGGRRTASTPVACMTTLVQALPRHLDWHAHRGPWVLAALALGLLMSLLWASGQGAYGLPLRDLPAVIAGALGSAPAERSGAELVFFNIRLPRLVLGVAAGAGLGLAGALMQGLFRNPLADP